MGNLYMTDADIAKEYREAKNPYAQIKILADENETDDEAILAVLERQGVEDASRYRRMYAVMRYMLEDNATDKEIAQAIGLSIAETAAMRSRAGLKRNRGRPKYKND